jgi:3-hydroxy-9,10-secoandrosta-1,3,5(10)-triene-9,17-dione monooxygenase reductase component
MQTLQARGFLHVGGDGAQAACRLTDVGRDRTLHLIAAAKAYEAGILARFGDWDAVALKNLLKRFVVETDLGLPQVWGGADESEGDLKP